MKTAIVCLQYGDSGKGRVSAYFAPQYDWSIRFNGGPNAGHTVFKDGKEYKLHQLPAGILFEKKVALDTGMVVDMKKLTAECTLLGVDIAQIFMSENVHLIQEQHLNADATGSGIGSTKSGIGPVYADRVLRKGIRARSFEYLSTLPWLLPTLYRGLPPIQRGESALFEGAQGIMLDVDYGCYPYVTSSSIMPSSVHRINHFIGVMKGYITRVGDGPPCTPDILELRKLGKEYGATTGRPRKCHWLDMDELRYAISIVQPDEIVVTKLDVLAQLDIPICVYEDGHKKSIGNIDLYQEYLLEKFPQIRYLSFAPDGEMVKV